MKRSYKPSDGVRRVVALVGLPRTGTTVTAALLGSHSEVCAVFEPWNGSKNRIVPSDPDLPLFLEAFAVNVRNGSSLLVKETTTRLEFVHQSARLLRRMPAPIQTGWIWIVRTPAHTYLSEVQARREWWGADGLTVSPESFEQWLAKSLRATRVLASLTAEQEGIVFSYEHLTTSPELGLKTLMQVFELEPQAAQREFHRAASRHDIRGDIGFATRPRALSEASTRERAKQWDEAYPALRGTRGMDVFQALTQWCEQVRRRGVIGWNDPLLEDLDKTLRHG
jgi:hypothetical protein